MLESKPPSYYIDGLAHDLFTSGRHSIVRFPPNPTSPPPILFLRN